MVLENINMVEFYFSMEYIVGNISNYKLNHIRFGTSKGEIGANFTNITIGKVRNKDFFKVSALRYQGDPINPTSIRTLSDLEIVDDKGQPLQLTEVRQVVVYGTDANGYSIAKPVKVPSDANYLNTHDVIRHLVVTGIHGNFKDSKKAKERASHYKNAKVIRIHA